MRLWQLSAGAIRNFASIDESTLGSSGSLGWKRFWWRATHDNTEVVSPLLLSNNDDVMLLRGHRGREQSFRDQQLCPEAAQPRLMVPLPEAEALPHPTIMGYETRHFSPNLGYHAET